MRKKTTETEAAPARRVLGTTIKNLRVQLTEKDLLDKGKELAELQNKACALENDKKRVVSQYKADLDALAARIEEAANILMSGYRFDDVECELIADMPEPNQKSYVRKDTGEIVSTMAMTAEDKQEELPLDDSDDGVPEEEA